MSPRPLQSPLPDPVLASTVFCAAIALGLTSLLLFALGHRLRRAHWLLSLITVGSLAGLSVWIQQELTGAAPPVLTVVACALGVGALVAAAFERWNPLGHAGFSAVLLLAVLYLCYTVFALHAARLGPWSLAFGIVLFLLQLAAMVLLVAHTFEILDVLCRTRWERRAGAKHVPGFVPKVSIHVPIHCEPPRLVIETLDALARLDYTDFEVLVIDNNTADESLWRPVEAHCAELGSKFRFYHLMPWPGFKSGALNFALEHTSPEAAILGIVDADYIVDRNWLSDLVGHFDDGSVAFVQTPQDYRDTESRGLYGRALALSYIYFFRISMASRNERNAIIFAGTMGLLRKSALQEIGGWNEWCITEDAEVSVRLLNAGHQSVYVDETYGRGIMPLDYSGLKKQRFRWAFGGMQVLRMHAGVLFNPWAKGYLTQAQRAAFVSSGLQWLNDPITMAFTFLLVIGSAALLLQGSIEARPLIGAVLVVPPLFLLFSLLRFLWALRIRERTTWLQALQGLVLLLGLTWVVALACVRGLFSREGVFLRTPKQGDEPSLGEAFAVVRWESGLALACCIPGFALAWQLGWNELSARTLVTGLLFWQAAIYFCAPLSALWNHSGLGKAPKRVARGFLAPFLSKALPERRTAAWIAAAALLTGQLLFMAIRNAPMEEQLFRADPLRQFLPAASIIGTAPEERAGALLVTEADATLRGIASEMLTLWLPDGVVVDCNFTPDDPSDDRIWRGIDGIEERYEEEFLERRYLSLRHLNPEIVVAGDDAIVVNDLDALILAPQDQLSGRVQRARSDLWTLRRVDGIWRIARLEVNRSPLGATPPSLPMKEQP